MTMMSTVNKEMETRLNNAKGKIMLYAAAAAAASLASGFIPVVSDVAVIGIALGFTWSLYIAINKEVGLKVEHAALKTIASGILSNIAGNVAGLIAGAVLASLIPGAGGIAWAALIFGMVYLSGMTYISALRKLCKGEFNANLDAEAISEAMEEELKQHNIADEVKKASQMYKQGRKDGQFTGTEAVVLEND